MNPSTGKMNQGGSPPTVAMLMTKSITPTPVNVKRLRRNFEILAEIFSSIGSCW